jgi:tetratricopeptide (TPR) repeat protein
MNMGDFGDWDQFDSAVNTHSFRDPQLGDYLFEEDNAFRAVGNPYEEGVKIMNEGGNLSLAALAFEAAVQKDPQHIEAWTMLGSAQAQNEKETPAIRALEQALKLDPNNLDALMGLAVSYTNEGYDSTAYRTLERWLSIKYPGIIDPKDITPDADLSFTDRYILHQKVTDFFIRAAQLSPAGEHMDPDVQVGLGVLFYGAEEYDKAVDCFSAALASTESGISNQKGQVHLLWNRLGATLANSGRSEEAIEAYEKALNINPNFVRARYNLGVSCVNIGCYPEAAQHLLGALSMHKVVEQEGRERAREIVDGVDGIGDEQLEHMIHISQNQSTNLYDTLRRVFNQMNRRDLADMVVSGMDVGVFRKEFDF